MNCSVLFTEQILEILSNTEVVLARNRLQNIPTASSKISFSIELSDSIKTSIKNALGLDLFGVKNVPMRWIKGDSTPHIDSGEASFQNTYLVYLTNSDGEFLVDNVSYPIQAGQGFVFSEGLSHETRDTQNKPRLLLGPMSESGFPVGGVVRYFPTQADALALTNDFNPSGSYSYTVETVGGFSAWRLASNSIGTSSQLVVYVTGDTLISDSGLASYYLYPAYPCFLEGSTILCLVDGEEKYVPIETIRKDTLVKTSRDGFKKVELIGHSQIQNSGTDEESDNRLYVCKKENYPELTEDLFITGAHSILVDTLTEEQREKTVKNLGKVFVTDKKYRLMAYLDPRAEPWVSEGKYTVWHLALENSDITMNYGVYANGGLLVETTSINFLKNKSNMALV
jgi:hypothetical protein